MMKYQQLRKDLEPQDTAGLDIAVADTLHSLGQHTQLDAEQVRNIDSHVACAQRPAEQTMPKYAAAVTSTASLASSWLL